MTTGARLKIWAAGLVVATGLLLVVQNQQDVTTRFLFWSVRMPQFVLVSVVFALGAVAGFVAGWQSGRPSGDGRSASSPAP